MAYEHEIFVSYRRSPTVGMWVKNHLMPRLQPCLDEVAPNEVRVFCDYKMDSGVHWPNELKHRLCHSGLLLAVWSADYFRSDWCMAEWGSFREREKMLGLFSRDQPRGLVYPLRFADGEYFHADAKRAQCRRDFSHLNYPDDAFRQSAKYMEFHDQIREMAEELVRLIQTIPPWKEDFPTIELKPLPPPVLPRPVL